MKKTIGLILMTFCIVLTTNAYNGDGVSFNDGWLFHKGEAEGAENAQYQDKSWEKLNLPHDWAIYGPFDIKYNPRCGGLPFYGTGWYKKYFTAKKSWEGKTVRIAFDGAMSNSYVWINGHFLGNRPYGYIGFEYDVTKYLKPGKENVLAVRLTPKDLSSRWYPGAGIYRNTWIKIDDAVHVGQYGTSITTPTLTEELGVVQIETELVNNSASDKNVIVKHQITNKKGELVLTLKDKVHIKANSEGLSQIYSPLENPELWSIENPALYKVKTIVLEGNKECDVFNSRFGFRTIRFEHDGFFLNNKKVHFKGVCLHMDNGPLGVELNIRSDQRKLEILKSMGVNAIRTSHNPQSPEFLDLCDEMGFIVLDEAFDEWEMPKVENGYHVWFDKWAVTDIKDMVRRDRNHPSVIMWSLGNEIREQNDKQKGWTVAKKLGDAVRTIDLTRPVTCGMDVYPAPFNDNFAQQLGISGINYKPGYYAELYKKYPDLLYYGSETESCTSSRGIYHLPVEKYQTHKSKQVTSYDIVCPSYAYPPDIEFFYEKQNPQIMGGFIWTGFDYLGEPTPYGEIDNWPSRSSYFGAVDLAGFPKDRFYLYQSEWTKKPMVHILPHWNWKGMEGNNIPVFVYTNADEVDLFLNGKSLGKKVKGVDKTTIPVHFSNYTGDTFNSPYRLSWNVPYKKGSLTAKAYKNGLLVAEQNVNTAGKPEKVIMSPDRKIIKADGKDLSYITVRIEDKEGNLCPNADNLVHFSVKGDGILKAVGNGNSVTTESFQDNKRKAFSGMCLLIVQSKNQPGIISVKASSNDLSSSKIEIETVR